MKLILLIILLLLLSACGPLYTYPEGATAMEKMQIDMYYQQQGWQILQNTRPAAPTSRNCSYSAGMMYCW